MTRRRGEVGVRQGVPRDGGGGAGLSVVQGGDEFWEVERVSRNGAPGCGGPGTDGIHITS